MRSTRIGFGISAIIVVTLLASQPLLAKGKKGPRASATSATVCAVQGSDFTVRLTLRDKTSGDAIPILTAWSIDALAKTGKGRWAQQEVFASASAGGLGVPIPNGGGVPFLLCVPDGLGGFVINPVIEGAKGLNASTEVTYGRLNTDTGAVEDQRTIMNMCSDDPATEDVVEPSGIALDPIDIADIAIACLAK